ncbi:site-specific integrase [Niabella hibiscisoli]|uniref:site-specific integrase n=1 Tax=Niabella hibiscisoli TaxID=1825928 RepID=UPI001F0D1F51|nr:site-specific integrase [Niabella hibiscisoli]MCH5717482.1 site-specific integrase [Niabella hibiscisoli]
MWAPYKKGFKAYLQLEKSLSDNSTDAYLRDLDKLVQFLEIKNIQKILQPSRCRICNFLYNGLASWK